MDKVEQLLRRFFKPFRVEREAVDSARGVLDGISIPRYERVISELACLQGELRTSRGARASTLKRVK